MFRRLCLITASLFFLPKPIGFQNGEAIYVLYCVNKNPELTGGVVTNAVANISPETSAPVVNMEMNSKALPNGQELQALMLIKELLLYWTDLSILLL